MCLGATLKADEGSLAVQCLRHALISPETAESADATGAGTPALRDIFITRSEVEEARALQPGLGMLMGAAMAATDAARAAHSLLVPTGARSRSSSVQQVRQLAL